MRGTKKFLPYGLLLGAILPAAAPFARGQAPSTSPASELDSIRNYISDGWNTLSRSLTDCATYADPKLSSAPQLYLPYDFSVPQAVRALETRCGVHVSNLPRDASLIGQPRVEKIEPPGLLYLEKRYVVPGGRFNEMYGWDSYFIILGLLRDARLDLAQGMVDNFLFEVEHYGAVLNANRSYYLTRSQPPFLTSMVLAVYDAQETPEPEKRAWLAKAYELAVKDHEFWTVQPHLAGNTGLSRYYDFGEGPAPESVQDETGHYRDVAAYFLAHPETGQELTRVSKSDRAAAKVSGKIYSVQVCDPAHSVAKATCSSSDDIALTADFYKGDRSMRESGFDISFRFGPYGARTQYFAPVGLNSLLYKEEKDLQRISEILGHKEESAQWKLRAAQRRANIQKYLWDPRRGLYFDYDFQKQKQSSYEYLTAFYPLWVGAATKEQASVIVKNLSTFERPGGLAMSPYETGAQWDSPYAWAPCQLIADDGLRRYGLWQDADRLSYNFLSMVLENFRRDGTIREKYNAVTRSSETQVSAGYRVNVVGFGWTNGVFLQLLSELSPSLVNQLAGKEKAAIIFHPRPSVLLSSPLDQPSPLVAHWGSYRN
ncbi:MAG TPA: trehalase family glycosidase [Candidatus Eisenbacteria bacterium]|nr:trehalase family glycosidase [Candidatus Eisenbacteria bacterium]